MMNWNQMLWSAITCGVAFLLTTIFGKLILPVLRARKVGQIIREEGPAWHKSKSGTPTMGGICFILSFLLIVSLKLILVFL